MAEQLALQQRLGQRAAVDDDQRMKASRAAGMNGARHQFLSGAAFAGDEDRSIGWRDRLDGIEDVLHGGALADDVGRPRNLRDRLLQTDIFLLGAAMRHGFRDQVSDLVRVERLIDVVISPVLERGDRGLDRSVAGHDDDQHVGIDFVQSALQLDAIGAAHLDVDQGNVIAGLGHARQRLAGTFGRADLVAFFGKPFGERIAHAQFIVDDEQLAFFHSATSLPLGCGLLLFP